MGRSHIHTLVVMIASVGVVATAQKVTSPQEFTQGMKTIGASVAAAKTAMSASLVWIE